MINDVAKNYYAREIKNKIWNEIFIQNKKNKE